MAFPPHDFAQYTWHTSDIEPDVYVRHAAGGEQYEDYLNRYFHGQQNLFLGVHLALANAIAAKDFLPAARSAWVVLRHAVPTIAATTTHDADENTIITYRVAQDLDCAEAWAKRTVHLVTNGRDVEELRVELGQRTLPYANGDQTFIHVVPKSLTEYAILLHTHHTPFDGAGTKLLLTRYLQILARHLGLDNEGLAREELAALSWGREGANLLPPCHEVIAPDEPMSGPLYDQTLGTIMQGFVDNIPRSYGYRKRGEGVGITRRMEHKFTLEQSTEIKQAGRALGLTVNHLAHAAVFLSALYDNPVSAATPPDAAFFCFGLVESRARLRAPHNEPFGYPGYCLAISGITVPLSDVQGDDRRAQLVSTANAIKREYAAQKALPAPLSVIAQEIDLVVKHATSNPPPPPWMGPWYAGDGIGENQLQPVYEDKDGKEAIRVVDYVTTLNQDVPGPYFRAYSWGGRLTISVDHNDTAMPAEAVQGFLQSVVESLLSLIAE